MDCFFLAATCAANLPLVYQQFTKINGTAEIAIYNGGSLWAEYWIETVTELRGDLISSGKVEEGLIDRFLACCSNRKWWTQTIAFTAVHGRTFGG